VQSKNPKTVNDTNIRVQTRETFEFFLALLRVQVGRLMTALSLSDAVVRADGLIEAEIDNEIVALNIEKGSCYGLNPVGARVWRFLVTPARISDICTRLVSEYDVEQDVCERQVLDLLEELRAEGLVAISEEK
jgi:Coenzyme PQQ synthesis protein D (PqqD)